MSLQAGARLAQPADEGNSPRGGAWNGQATKDTSCAPSAGERRFTADSIGGVPRSNDRIAAATTGCRAASNGLRACQRARKWSRARARERRGRIKSEEDDADAENRSFAFNGCAQSLERWARQDENNSPDVAFRATTRAAGAVTTRRHTHPHTTRLITFSPITAARQLPQRPDLRSATTVRRHPRVQP